MNEDLFDLNVWANGLNWHLVVNLRNNEYQKQ